MIDWESKFAEHQKILEDEKRERDERLELSGKMRAGWELARMCREYIQENSNSWRGEEEERRKKREKERERDTERQKAVEQRRSIETE